MKPDNQQTNPEQRFHFPLDGEAECHESFNFDGVPQAEIMPGPVTYAVTESSAGDRSATRLADGPSIKSGSRLLQIVSSDIHTTSIPQEHLPLLAERTTVSYELKPDDLLICSVTYGWRNLAGTPLQEQMNEDSEAVVLPVSEPLPYTNRTNSGTMNEEVGFTVAGIIRADSKLLAWPGPKSYYSQYIIDLCVANAHIQNFQELEALDAEVLSIGRRSLVGIAEIDEAASMYLAYFDRKYGTHYTPTQEPHDRYDEFTDVLEIQKSERARQIGRSVFRNFGRKQR